ncbi:MAG: thioredoxin domain-containing protein, partial [Pirellulaceae bacterium]
KYYAPQLKRSLKDIAAANSLSVGELQNRLHAINTRLLKIREQRPRPLLDNKILTSWNGLMIRGLADAGRILEKPEYVEAAVKAAEFVLNHSYVDGRLKRTFTAGQARLNGYLDDYAFLIDGLLGLHQATGDEKWLKHAGELQIKQNELYWDDKAGGFFFTSTDHESLLARAKNPADGALPSGNSVSMANLMYLATALEKAEYRDMVKKSLEGSSSLMNDFPTIAPRLLIPVKELLK